MTSNRAQDQVRPVGRAQTVSAPPTGRGTAGGGEPRPEAAVPLAKSGRRWSVRVHWGIVFAIVASVALWLAIKLVVALAF